MAVELDQGFVWIAGALAAFPLLNQALAFFQRLKGPARQPPLAEEVAGKYATRSELDAFKREIKGDIDTLRKSIEETDRKAEARSIDTHRRIDMALKSLMATNRKLGTLIGIAMAQGRANASDFGHEEEEGG